MLSRKILTEDRPSNDVGASKGGFVKVGETEDRVQILDTKEGVVKEYPKKRVVESANPRKLLME